METIYTLQNLRERKPSVLTVGVFDGVHIGHQEIMSIVKADALELGARSVVVTFDRNPEEYVHPAANVPNITTLRQKLERIAAQEIDMSVVLPIEPDIMELPARRFVSDILCEKLCAVQVVVGTNFLFGKGRSGSVELLREMGERAGFEVISVPPIKSGSIIVSSTAIRRLISDGRIEKANELLGHPFVLEGRVVAGKGIGRQLGYPTANVEPVQKQIVPGKGVYAMSVNTGRTQYAGVANIGVCPTLGDGPLTVEVHIIGFEGDLYGQDIELVFRHRLRGEVRFSDTDALKQQIARDVEEAARLIG